MNSTILRGKGIVVTRPRAQAGEMLTLLEAQGARPILFPAVEIEAPENWQSLDDALHRLVAYDW
ncbi:uroporphyrinogen-III synthase, partial [Acidithiobacillus ferrooxidans]